MTADTEPTNLPANLGDVLELLAELRDVKAMGRRGRQILFALQEAAGNLHNMTGLIVNGEAHPVYLTREYAPCGCRNTRHPFVKDQAPWFGRGQWQRERADAEKARARVAGHMVTRYSAETPMTLEDR